MKKLLCLLFVAVAACGDDDSFGDDPSCPPTGGGVGIIDYGEPPPPPPRPPVPYDAGTSPPRQTTLTLLRAASSSRFLGVTSGASPHAAYLVRTDAGDGTFDLEVIPVAGGAPVVLAKGIALSLGDGAEVTGGAVAWFTGVDADNHASEVHFWTAAAGAKTVTTTTVSGIFFASDDGTRVAFSVNATADSTEVAVTSAAAPVATAALTGATALNLSVSALDCPSQIAFRGTTLIGAYCTGVATTPSQPLLVTVGADGAAVVRLDNTVPANDFDGTWGSDPSGAKIVVNDAVAGAHLVDASTATTVVGTLAGVETTRVLPDGTATLIVTAGALKKATFANPPVVTPILASGVGQLFTVTKDAKTLVYSKTNLNGFTDLFALDLTATTPVPVTLQASPTTLYFGLTGTESHVFYIDGSDPAVAKVASVPLAGGPAVSLVDPVHKVGGGLDVEPAPSGTGLVFTVDSDLVIGTALERSTLGYVDALKGGGLEPAATLVRLPDERGQWSGKTYVFRDSGTTPGIYALTLP